MAFQPVSDAAQPHIDRSADLAAADAAAPDGDNPGAGALYHEVMIKAHLRHALDHALKGDMTAGLAEALCAALETVCGGSPDTPLFDATRSDAEFWADCATPIELECYSAAALRRIARTTFAPRAQKRLFVAFWLAMEPEDRRRFLARVDPDGTFVRGGA